MEIMMFIIFIITNLIIILCMQFAYTHAYKYENGMYLNVHIPSSHKEDAEVTEIVTTGKCKMKHFQIANVIISIAICFIVFINIAVFVLDVCIYLWNYSYSKQLPPENVCSENTKRMDNRSPTQKGLYRHPRFSRSRCHDSQL